MAESTRIDALSIELQPSGKDKLAEEYGKVIENSSIDQMKKASQSHYKIVVDHTDKLKDYLAYPMEIKNSQEIEVDVTREQVPEVVKVLVKQNVKVYEVQEVQMSLEDAFLKRTGGNKID